MTDITDDIRTSALVQEDIQLLKDNLRLEPESSGAPWWRRALAILHAQLPMVVFLEDSGRAVAPADLLDLNRLEKLLFDASHALGSAFVGPSQWIEEHLGLFPGYVLALRGAQSPATCQTYTIWMLQARSLAAACPDGQSITSPSAAARGPQATSSESMAGAMPSPGLVYTDRQARDKVAAALGMPLSEARSYAWEYLLSVVKGLADDPTGEALWHNKRAAPDRKGVYAWVTSTGHAALVLVGKRPTEHCAAGTLNAVVMDSVKFYDGCAVDQWGKDGRWVLLHAFPEVPTANGANHD